MTEQDTTRSYDDIPESDVSTVLQVPLVWEPTAGDPAASPGAGAGKRRKGRHRAERPAHSTATRAPASNHQHLVTTARVGLTSATLVLAIFAVVLLALARWLP